jgi:hypothetical protein
MNTQKLIEAIRRTFAPDSVRDLATLIGGLPLAHQVSAFCAPGVISNLHFCAVGMKQG